MRSQEVRSNTKSGGLVFSPLGLVVCIVSVKLLKKDQYSRAVATIRYGSWPFTKDLSEELLKRGYAVVYRQGGAEYDGRKDKFEALEANAKAKKAGLWERGRLAVELPSQYKARQRLQQLERMAPAAAN